MFDKIPSLKDFIIYVIPGFLISYFSLNIVSFYTGIRIWKSDSISDNSGLLFIGIIFSFLLGFIICQFVIIINNYVSELQNSEMQKLKNITITTSNNEIKRRIAQQIIRIFRLHNVSINDIMDDPSIFDLCYNFVKIKSNEESHRYLNRQSDLSTFAITLNLPIILGIWNLFIKLGTSTCIYIPFIVILSILIIILTKKISLNFRRGWIESTYKQFLILS